jgi:hypothetical protein
MTPISQKSPGIKGNELGTCPNETFGSSGCKLISLASMYDLDPVELNQQFIKDGAYVNGCMLDDTLAAKSLGVEFDGKTTTMPTFMCIAETDNYASSGYPQHFFVWIGQGNQIMDPITGTIKTNNYHIVSFRLFKENTMGFSDENMRSIVDATLRQQRTIGLGKVDEVGLKADVDSAMAKIKTGNVTILADILENYSKATDSVLMKKTDCKPTVCPPVVVCPDMSLYTLTSEIKPCPVVEQVAPVPTTTSTADYIPAVKIETDGFWDKIFRFFGVK